MVFSLPTAINKVNHHWQSITPLVSIMDYMSYKQACDGTRMFSLIAHIESRSRLVKRTRYSSTPPYFASNRAKNAIMVSWL